MRIVFHTCHSCQREVAYIWGIGDIALGERHVWRVFRHSPHYALFRNGETRLCRKCLEDRYAQRSSANVP